MACSRTSRESRSPRWAAGGSTLLALAALPALASLAPPDATRRPSLTPNTQHLTPNTQHLAFNRDIRPILTDNCFTCHGPDKNKRVAGFRLDVREEAVARGVIVPGKPEKSRLVARVFAKDAARRMPPASTHKTLTPEQKALLRRWIAEGAKYEPHWAFVPPRKPALPPAKDVAWCRNPIDRFVLARLEAEGLRPSPDAAPEIWLRRVTYDLTGLPPTVAEIDAFLADLRAEGLPAEHAEGRGKGPADQGVANAAAFPRTDGSRSAQSVLSVKSALAPLSPSASFRVFRGQAAYERVVDRLLASPRYGERMAVPWLDVARYGDSYGYQSDQLCPTWPYRDWVVKAFNDNLPYDQFLTQQLAGDLVPNATREQRVATAFNRLHRMTNEGGSVPEEWRLEGVADRVNTFGTAFLGLTLECARCHDHKYDPVSQRDYYALSAFFNNIDEHGLYDRADIVPSPSLLLPTPEQEQKLAAAREAAAKAGAALDAARRDREAAFRAWLSHPGGAALPDQTGRFDFEAFEGGVLKNQLPGATRHGSKVEDVALGEGHTGRGLELDGDDGASFAELGRFTRHTPFTIAFWMKDARRAAEPAVVFQGCSGTDAGPHGYDLILEQGHLSARMFRHWPGNGIGIRTRAAVPKDTWTHVAVTYDGSSRAAGLRIYLDGRPADTDVLRDRLTKGTGVHTLVFGQRFRDKGFKGGRIDDLAIFSRALAPVEVGQLRDGQRLAAALADPAHHEPELREYYFTAVDPETRRAWEVLSAARAAVVAAEDVQQEIAVMEEMPQPRPAYVLARGRYDAPRTEGNRVERSVPAAVLPFSSGFRRDRLGLAQWLVSRDHPLTARVAVNRIWAQLWGRGLVETVENFGLQGRLPSHPELLDYLAYVFSQPVSSRGDDGEKERRRDRGTGLTGRASGARALTPNTQHLTPSPDGLGWNTKALIKLIVLSSTYRQSSALSPSQSARSAKSADVSRPNPGRRGTRLRVAGTAIGNPQLKDPDNLLLGRGPSRRLSAEAVRDTALAASGLLDGRLGGPPVSPYQPGDLWREANSMSPPYRQSVGGDLYRRSLYTVWKRTAPMPNMLAFDAPSREVCVARRQATGTPLQALVLLNDPQFVEAARVLGERALKEGGSTAAERVRFVFRALATREPAPEELRVLVRFYEGQRAQLAADPAGAAKLLQVGASKADSALPPAESAAAALLAQAVLNLDAVMWER